jgi:predicted nucleic acid-binding protein
LVSYTLVAEGRSRAITMKFTDVLRGHIFPDEERKKAIWASAHFCLDTNVLLDVYRYTPQNRAAFLKLLAAMKGRLFVPHRVAVEFARNRISVIRGHFRPQRIIQTKLDEAAEEIRKKHPKHQLLQDLEGLVERAKKLVDDHFGEAERQHLSLITDDTILGELLAAIGEEVGEPYPEGELQTEYKRRKQGNIPPFCKIDDDDKDEERRTGDVVIWLELLKKYEGTKTPLIFVTDDMKANWWQESGGRHDPQPALVQEAYTRTGADLLFYTAERFSETAPRRLGVEVPKGLAEETRDIREQEREAEQEQRIVGEVVRQLAEPSLGWQHNNDAATVATLQAWTRRSRDSFRAVVTSTGGDWHPGMIEQGRAIIIRPPPPEKDEAK